MTTIAANRKEMAADRLVSGGTFSYHCPKIHRIRGHIVGVAGNTNNTTKFLAWYRKECPPDEVGMTLDEDHDFIGLVLKPDGLYVYSDCVEPDKIDDAFISIGSGSDYATGAMACGKSPHDAVKIAARFDPSTGGKIDVMSPLDPKSSHKARTRKSKTAQRPVATHPESTTTKEA